MNLKNLLQEQKVPILRYIKFIMEIDIRRKSISINSSKEG